DILLQAVEPAVEDRTERAEEAVRGTQLLHRTPVDGFEPVERRLGLGNLDLGGGEALLLRLLLHPAPEERLAAAVVAPDGFEHRRTLPHVGQFRLDDRLEPTEAHGEKIKAALRHGPFPQGGDDLTSAFAADVHALFQIELPLQFGGVTLDTVL